MAQVDAVDPAVSAARARRRLMAFDRYRNRGLRLGAPTVPWFPASAAHCRAFFRVVSPKSNAWSAIWIPRPKRRTPP